MYILYIYNSSLYLVEDITNTHLNTHAHRYLYTIYSHTHTHYMLIEIHNIYTVNHVLIFNSFIRFLCLILSGSYLIWLLTVNTLDVPVVDNIVFFLNPTDAVVSPDENDVR